MDGLQQAVRNNLQSKGNDELLQIWTENNRILYSDSIFKVIGETLIERGVKLPVQNGPAPLAERHQPPYAPYVRLLRWTGIILVIHYILLLVGGFDSLNGVRTAGFLLNLNMSKWHVGYIYLQIIIGSLLIPLIGFNCGLALSCYWRSSRRWILSLLTTSVIVVMVELGHAIFMSWYSRDNIKQFISTLWERIEWSILSPLTIPFLLLVLVATPPIRSLLEGHSCGFAVD
jgi:hypothetical protein